MEETLYSEGAGPATWVVVLGSFIAAAIAGTVWIRELTSGDAFSASTPSSAVSAVVAMTVGLAIGFGGVETLIRRKIVLTDASLRVGREAAPLSRLAHPVLSGDRLPEAVRSGARVRNGLPSGCRALGDVPRAILGQGTVTVVGTEPREVLVLHSWRPQVLAHILSRALESLEGEPGAPDPWR